MDDTETTEASDRADFRKQMAMLLAAIRQQIQESRSSKKSLLTKVSDALLGPVLIGVACMIYGLDRRVGHIESTRYTSTDFEKRMADVDRKIIGTLKEEFTSLSVKMDNLRDSVARVSERVVRLEAK